MKLYKDKKSRKIFKGADSTIENHNSQIVFDSSIKKICIYNKSLIILTNEKLSRNIYCLNQELDLLWKIQSSLYDIPGNEDLQPSISYYIDINLDRHFITAKNFSDFEVIINIDNGKIINERIVR